MNGGHQVLRLVWLLMFIKFVISLESDYDSRDFTNEFAVEIDGDSTVADLVAETHNLRLVRQVSSLGNLFHFSHEATNRRSRRSSDDFVNRLSQDPNVRRVVQQRVLMREKRSVIHDKQIELPIRHFDDKSVYQRPLNWGISTKDEIPSAEVNDGPGIKFNDPYFKDQWYLLNRGQTGGIVGYDINVVPVWLKGITGRGVVLTILDDGIDHNHPDLEKNYDAKASTDLNDKEDIKNDPVPNALDDTNSHGTRCAGAAAAGANNSNCGVGVAFNAKIGGVRMLDGPVTDLLEAEALTFNNQYVDIYSASWGPTDDGKTMEGPHLYCRRALQQGVTKGRGGKGSIFVWATGNGGAVGDDCSCDGYVSSIYTLSVGCISDHGLSTYFSEICPSTMAVVFTGGSHHMPGEADYKAPKIKVVTTDLNGECTLEFQGTSSAAPIAAGCIALVLEANGNLTWRDVQNIVVETARIPNDEEDGWTVNGGGHHVNHRFGFGALDCARMVEAAQSWITVQEQHNCSVVRRGHAIDIYTNRQVTSSMPVDACRNKEKTTIDHLEHVQVYVKLEHQRRGDLTVILTSPAGTKSTILSRRRLDDSSDGIDFTFMTVHNWGENPSGVWTLSIEDSPSSGDTASSVKRGRLLSWSLLLYGVAGELRNHKRPSAEDSSKIPHRKGGRGEISREVGSNELHNLMAIESSDSVSIESSQQLMRKSQSDGVLSDELNPEDVEFLRELFETEEAINEKSGGASDTSISDSHPGHDASRSDKPNHLSQNVGRRQFASSGRDHTWNRDRRAQVESDINLADLRQRVEDIDGEKLDKFIEDLSEFVDSY